MRLARSASSRLSSSSLRFGVGGSELGAEAVAPDGLPKPFSSSIQYPCFGSFLALAAFNFDQIDVVSLIVIVVRKRDLSRRRLVATPWKQQRRPLDRLLILVAAV